MLVNGAEPRFQDHRHWKVGYEPQAAPAISIWNAWDWVDRWNAQWLGWWENKEFLNVECRMPNGQKPEVYASLWLQKGKNHPSQGDFAPKVLLIVTNYETEPLDDAEVKLNLAKCEFKGKVYAEDAVTLEPIAITPDGAMKLDILQQRYRLVKISNEPPRFRDDALGPNIFTNVPPAALTNEWRSRNSAGPEFVRLARRTQD